MIFYHVLRGLLEEFIKHMPLFRLKSTLKLQPDNKFDLLRVNLIGCWSQDITRYSDPLSRDLTCDVN